MEARWPQSRRSRGANEKRTPPPKRIAGAGFGRPLFQSTPLVEGNSLRGSTIERARPRRVPGKSRAEGKCEMSDLILRTGAAVIRHFQERMPYVLFVSEAGCRRH